MGVALRYAVQAFQAFCFWTSDLNRSSRLFYCNDKGQSECHKMIS